MKVMQHEDVVIRPVVTEKTIKQSDRQNCYTFVVHEDANKVQIRRAVESLFKVKVEDVRTHRYIGKRKRVGRWVGHTGTWKKAVVRLKAGDSIDFY